MSGTFGESVMAIITLIATIGSIIYGYRKNDAIVKIWAVPLVFMFLFYVTLVWDIEPLSSDLDLRLSVYRPALFFFLVFVAIFTFNGKVNRVIEFVLDRVEVLWTRLRSKT